MGDDEYYTLDEIVSSETSESAVVYGAIEDEEEKCTFPKTGFICSMPLDFKPSDDFEELVCSNCVKRFPLLWLFYYCQMQSGNVGNAKQLKDGSLTKKPRIDDDPGQLSTSASFESAGACRIPHVLSVCGVEKLDLSTADMGRLTVNGFPFPSPIFWCNDWRTDTLCTCDSCEKMLKSLGIAFLLDPEDSVVHYMEIGRQRVAELHARRDNLISEALAELPHPAAVEVARGINRFREALTDFLTRPREKNVVTEEEVKEFCEDLKKDL
ncbi:putative E3 ubiquitin-protein ligase UBR7 [Taenia crassiceps]|uniref:E3 ubiquitin-protein ligase UBR7 n=1 Tax=Taenia crassiceps TaxID=6207 RepID=A0ABR4QG10_9CEST